MIWGFLDVSRPPPQTNISYHLVFENCQLARYTPLNINEMSDDFEKAKLFIEKAEKIKK